MTPKPMPLPMDRARVIRRSIRCFVLGVAGAVPFLGVALAELALRLFEAISRDLGEPFPLARVRALQAGMAAAGFGGAALFGPAGWFLTLMIGIPVLTRLFWRGWREREEHQWNPARTYLFLGGALGAVGTALTCAVIALIVALHMFRETGP